MYLVRAAAELLGVGKNYVHNRIISGEIEAIDIGDQRVIYRSNESALDAFLESKRVRQSRRTAM